jgi:predicted helicase
MSLHSIHRYLTEVEQIRHYGGTGKETSIRTAFFTLLKEYAQAQGLLLVAEVSLKNRQGRTITPDGTLKDSLRQDWGYWESKDENDHLDDEISLKLDKGYPDDNILFEDSRTAVLIQGGAEVMRVALQNETALHRLLNAWVQYERPEVQHFRKAIELFKQDVPKVTETLRGIILSQENTNPPFVKAADALLALCRESINPEVSRDDVREMMIQHILTENIFNTVFDETQFHRENNIARALERVIGTFFKGPTRRLTLGTIQHYYQAINAAAAGIADHHEKQKFLKVIYETFYKSYNPKAADRLGVVYTPNELVQFMIRSTDYLLHRHFGKHLEDKGVEILDPATGTGTFICDIIDYLRKDKLEYKYTHELHANEVAILPYYISNLNIEYTYAQKMGRYAEFKNLCFVDTLDNMGFTYTGKQMDLFTPLTEENSKRIKAQNRCKISVIIGNPPYNAKQENYNYQNANRAYATIDGRIRDTFVKYGTAQNQIVVYDMYTRFYRWAMDRLQDKGIIAFVTNRSFIDSRTLDGFRKCVEEEFDYAYIIDTHSDVRANPKIAGTTHNVFGIQTGIAVLFLVKSGQKKAGDTAKLFYTDLPEAWRREEKCSWFSANNLETLSMEPLVPDRKHNWINQTDNDFDSLLPLVSKLGKAGKDTNVLFKLFSRGVETTRDEWVYDLDKTKLQEKAEYLIKLYNESVESGRMDFNIKWSSSLEASFQAGKKAVYRSDDLIYSLYRPFTIKHHFVNKLFNHRLTENHYELKGRNLQSSNILIAFNSPGNTKSFHVLASAQLVDLHATGDSQCIALYRYDEAGQAQDNLTDWGLAQFTKRYKDKSIGKEDVFHYVYAVLHHPAYRSKYAQNLKRDFPRIPLYKDFWNWAAWGKALMELHLGYEQAEPWPLQRLETDHKPKPKAKLKADKANHTLQLDENTQLSGIPPQAWEYKLGNRSALEWVLDQYKESTPQDPTIAARFDTYRFANHKEAVITLLGQVCRVSVETMNIIKQMP